MSKRVVCEWCGHSKSIAKDVDKAYAKGRADAIDKLEKIVNKIFSIQDNNKSKFRPSIVITKGMMEDILEQLNEQK